MGAQESVSLPGDPEEETQAEQEERPVWESTSHADQQQKVSPGARRLYERYTVYRHRPTIWMNALRLYTFGTRPERQTLYIECVDVHGNPTLITCELRYSSREYRAYMLQFARKLALPFDAEVRVYLA